jgi:hypothetical protein
MAEPSSKDPAAAWQNLVAQWEKSLNALANRTMGSDEFSKSINLGAHNRGTLGFVPRSVNPMSAISFWDPNVKDVRCRNRAITAHCSGDCRGRI